LQVILEDLEALHKDGYHQQKSAFVMNIVVAGLLWGLSSAEMQAGAS
jgi:hypothetical protein